ncbi:MAG: alpha-ketoacid dehydrogenase subunit beta [Candidatus Riflebacteria bacterium]|nr:alpha-ketoacid dehydrogenase subunit beta [Candidatus Riflebacteria bacterium]
MSHSMTFSQAINDALSTAMHIDKNVICYGLGTPDPKGIFGTSLGLQEKFGPERVFDMPCSENGMTGIAIGASLNGIRPVMTHQRLDFFLLAMDQLINNAANWKYMFGGNGGSVPITIRLIIGRGWGQGPTHSQSLHSWFAHVPGLKVVSPTTAKDAKGLLLSSIFDDDPVLFLEHRWLHNHTEEVPEGDFRLPLGKASLLREGSDLSVVSMSYMTVEAIHAIDYLHKECNVNCDLIDLRSINPIDWKTIVDSVRKTGRLLVLDTGWETLSVAGEIIARCATECFDSFKCPPVRMALQDCPTPTSCALTKNYYKEAADVGQAIAKMLNIEISLEPLKQLRGINHDVPGDWFKGPF